HFAARTNARPHRQRLLLRWVEAEEAQQAGVGAVIDRHQQLAARAKGNLAGGHCGFDLQRVALACVGQPHDAGFVLVAQRQVQRQVDVAPQTQLEQGLLGRARGRLGGQRLGHGTILPALLFRFLTWHGFVQPSSTMHHTLPGAPRTFTLSDFDFALPPELIAQHPAPERSASRLLDGRGAAPVDRIFHELPALLNPGDLMVFNDTQVIKARLFGEKPTGGKVELLVERVLSGNQVAAHMRVSKKPEPGTTLALAGGGGFRATLLGRWPDEQGAMFRLVLSNDAGDDPYALMALHGHVPLPPYIT